MAALFVTILFKLLLGLVFVAGAFILAKRLLFNRQTQHFGAHNAHYFGNNPVSINGRPAMYSQPVEVAPSLHKPATIVPVN